MKWYRTAPRIQKPRIRPAYKMHRYRDGYGLPQVWHEPQWMVTTTPIHNEVFIRYCDSFAEACRVAKSVFRSQFYPPTPEHSKFQSSRLWA